MGCEASRERPSDDAVSFDDIDDWEQHIYDPARAEMWDRRLEYIDEPVAGGASCQMFKVRDREAKGPDPPMLALKVMDATQPGIKEMWLNEVRILRCVSKFAARRNILEFVDAYCVNDRCYLLTVFYTGGDLFSAVETMGAQTYSEQRAAAMLKDMFRSLLVVHENRIAHRDVKPENFVFETPDHASALRLIDFGCSYHSIPPASTSPTSSSSAAAAAADLDLASGDAAVPADRPQSLYYVAPEVLSPDVLQDPRFRWARCARCNELFYLKDLGKILRGGERAEERRVRDRALRSRRSVLSTNPAEACVSPVAGPGAGPEGALSPLLSPCLSPRVGALAGGGGVGAAMLPLTSTLCVMGGPHVPDSHSRYRIKHRRFHQSTSMSAPAAAAAAAAATAAEAGGETAGGFNPVPLPDAGPLGLSLNVGNFTDAAASAAAASASGGVPRGRSASRSAVSAGAGALAPADVPNLSFSSCMACGGIVCIERNLPTQAVCRATKGLHMLLCHYDYHLRRNPEAMAAVHALDTRRPSLATRALPAADFTAFNARTLAYFQAQARACAVRMLDDDAAAAADVAHSAPLVALSAATDDEDDDAAAAAYAASPRTRRGTAYPGSAAALALSANGSTGGSGSGSGNGNGNSSGSSSGGTTASVGFGSAVPAASPRSRARSRGSVISSSDVLLLPSDWMPQPLPVSNPAGVFTAHIRPAPERAAAIPGAPPPPPTSASMGPGGASSSSRRRRAPGGAAGAGGSGSRDASQDAADPEGRDDRRGLREGGWRICSACAVVYWSPLPLAPTGTSGGHGCGGSPGSLTDGDSSPTAPAVVFDARAAYDPTTTLVPEVAACPFALWAAGAPVHKPIEPLAPVGGAAGAGAAGAGAAAAGAAPAAPAASASDSSQSFSGPAGGRPAALVVSSSSSSSSSGAASASTAGPTTAAGARARADELARLSADASAQAAVDHTIATFVNFGRSVVPLDGVADADDVLALPGTYSGPSSLAAASLEFSLDPAVSHHGHGQGSSGATLFSLSGAHNSNDTRGVGASSGALRGLHSGGGDGSGLRPVASLPLPISSSVSSTAGSTANASSLGSRSGGALPSLQPLTPTPSLSALSARESLSLLTASSSIATGRMVQVDMPEPSPVNPLAAAPPGTIPAVPIPVPAAAIGGSSSSGGGSLGAALRNSSSGGRTQAAPAAVAAGTGPGPSSRAVPSARARPSPAKERRGFCGLPFFFDDDDDDDDGASVAPTHSPLPYDLRLDAGRVLTSRLWRAADVWSLGVVMYVLLTGRAPFFSQEPAKIHAQVLACQWEHPAEVSAPALDLLRRILTKDPLQRPTAWQILHHPWLAPGSAPSAPLRHVARALISLRRDMLSGHGHLRRAIARALIAANIYNAAAFDCVAAVLDDLDHDGDMQLAADDVAVILARLQQEYALLAQLKQRTAAPAEAAANGDVGEVTAQALTAARARQPAPVLSAMHMDVAHDIMSDMNLTPDGKITRDELKVALAAATIGSVHSVLGPLESVFARLDRDGDGILSGDDLAAALAPFVAADDAHDMCLALSEDGDGQIGLSDFARAMIPSYRRSSMFALSLPASPPVDSADASPVQTARGSVSLSLSGPPLQQLHAADHEHRHGLATPAAAAAAATAAAVVTPVVVKSAAAAAPAAGPDTDAPGSGPVLTIDGGSRHGSPGEAAAHPASSTAPPASPPASGPSPLSPLTGPGGRTLTGHSPTEARAAAHVPGVAATASATNSDDDAAQAAHAAAAHVAPRATAEV